MEPQPSESVVLIGRPEMFRALLLFFLSSDAPDLKVIEVDDEADVVALGFAPRLIILISDFDDEENLPRRIHWLKASCRECPIVVIVQHEHRTDVLETLEAGASGVIPMSMSARDIIPVIRVLMAGGHFAPMLTGRTDQPSLRAEQHSGPQPRLPRNLSPREAQVVRLLHEGRSNKAIAEALQVQENTVKVHVRNILKKLNVRSRLEVVIATAGMSRF